MSSEPTKVPLPDRFFGGLGRTVVRFRWVVLALWIVAVVGTATLPSLSSEINNDNSQFLPATTPSSRAATLATPILGSFNNASNVTIAAATRSGPLDAADIATLVHLAAAVKTLPRVSAVRELAVSADGRAVQILVRSRINFADINRQKTLIDSLEHAIAAAHAPPGLQLDVAGPVATNVANQNQSQKTGSETQTFSLIFIVLLLLVIFRSLLAPLITLLPAGLSLLISTRLIGELGAHGLKISEITELLLIILVLGAGTDYGLFLVFRVREEIRRGAEASEAVERAVVRVGESITASAVSYTHLKHLGVRFREVCHVAAGWRCGRPRGRSRRQGRANTRALHPARPCPLLRKGPLSLDGLLFLKKAYTSPNAATIRCTKGTGSQSIGGDRLGRLLRCRRCSTHSRSCRTTCLLYGATSRRADNGYASQRNPDSFLPQVLDPEQLTIRKRPSTSQRVPRFGYPFPRSSFIASKPVEVRYAKASLFYSR